MGPLLCLLPLAGVAYLLAVVPLVGSWLSGWPEWRVAVRFASAIGVAWTALVASAAALAAVLWKLALFGDRYPFQVRVPSHFQGVMLIEVCPGEAREREVRLDPSGTARAGLYAFEDPCGPALVGLGWVDDARGTHWAPLSGCHLEPGAPCAVLAAEVAQAGVSLPSLPADQLPDALREVRATGRTATEVIAERTRALGLPAAPAPVEPAPPPDPP